MSHPTGLLAGIATASAAAVLILVAATVFILVPRLRRRAERKRSRKNNHYIGLPPAQYPGFEYPGYTYRGEGIGGGDAEAAQGMEQVPAEPAPAHWRYWGRREG